MTRAHHFDLEQDLARALEGEVRFDPYTRALFSTDASPYQIEPLGVVFPRSRDDVQAVVEITNRHGVPLLARGGGSSLAGQAVCAGVVIDFSKHMRRLLEINPQERWLRAEPGLVCDQLNASVRPHGLMFGPDPASANRATVGGMLGNNAAGAHSLLYGMTADHVLSVDALLADGARAEWGALAPPELAARLAQPGRLGDLYRGLSALVDRHAGAIRERYPRTWRRASGYSLNYLLGPHGVVASRPPGWPAEQPYPPAPGFNLAKLLAGSEGTLAVVTEARLNLVPRPACTGLSVLQFDSVVAAAEATQVILELRPSAVELIDSVLIHLARAMPAFARELTFVDGDPAALLVVEFFGDSDAHLAAQMDALDAHLPLRAFHTRLPAARAVTAAQQARVWAIRKVGLGLLSSMRTSAKPVAFMEDVAVPVQHLGQYVSTLGRLFEEHAVRASYYAHASAGCLHIRPIIDLKSADGVAKMRALASAVLEVVIGMGGAMSGEHGDGLSRSGWNGRLFGPELYDAFCAVKQLFDPDQRLNPGKVVHGPEMTANLRYGPAYQAVQLDTRLSFAHEGGFAAAVEQCNGAGVCLKADGTMCPSYMATRDEEHSTRGRANALRAALTGRLPPGELTSERMHAVLDLCLECKACKAECPSGVDMAKIKYEFLDHYHARHGLPLRARMFGHIHALSRLAGLFAPVLNPLLAASPVQWLNQRLFDITARRRLPAFASRSFRRQAASSQAPDSAIGTGAAGAVVLLVDTFTNYNQPPVGQAALRVLQAAGYRVLLPSHGCCGRPMLSKGLLREAQQAAARNVALLAPFARQGLAIVGLEPSCLLTLRDEYPDLLPGNEDAGLVARQAVLIDEFLVSLAGRGELRLNWRPSTGRQVLVHPHCHQRALAGNQALLAMLRLPGWQVSETNAGCCGMAGSFGYEAEHYDLSMAIGEDRLLPAMRAAAADVMLAAPGISCRQQIAHGAGRQVRHPIELLADALE